MFLFEAVMTATGAAVHGSLGEHDGWCRLSQESHILLIQKLIWILILSLNCTVQMADGQCDGDLATSRAAIEMETLDWCRFS